MACGDLTPFTPKKTVNLPIWITGKRRRQEEKDYFLSLSTNYPKAEWLPPWWVFPLCSPQWSSDTRAWNDSGELSSYEGQVQVCLIWTQPSICREAGPGGRWMNVVFGQVLPIPGAPAALIPSPLTMEIMWLKGKWFGLKAIRHWALTLLVIISCKLFSFPQFSLFLHL